MALHLTAHRGAGGDPNPAGDPTDEELAAIVAAVEVLWPRPGTAADPGVGRTAWRFSGRWWLSASPVAAIRRRP